jgi:S1-C subfamily serine protease
MITQINILVNFIARLKKKLDYFDIGMKYLIFLLTIFNTNILFSGEPDKKLHTDCIYPTVMITSSRGTQGTGVVIRSDKIRDDLYHNVVLSCKHILPDQSTKLSVLTVNYKNWSEVAGVRAYPARIYAQNDEHDLSIIIFSSKTEMPVAKLNLTPTLYIGNEVFRIGCGFQNEPRLDYGKVTSLNAVVAGKKGLIRTSVFTIGGDSGSAVYENNQIVGIMICIFKGEDSAKVNDISFFVPITVLAKWDEELNGTIGFAYKKEPLPVMEYFFLELHELKLTQ